MSSDQNITTEPTEEQIRLIWHEVLERWGTALSGLRTMSPATALGITKTVLALLPQRCAPSEEEIAAALHGDACPEDPEDGEPCLCDASFYDRQAGAVSALYAAQPTVREAKAEALWDAAAELQRVVLDNPSANPVMVIRARAERGEA